MDNVGGFGITARGNWFRMGVDIHDNTIVRVLPLNLVGSFKFVGTLTPKCTLKIFLLITIIKLWFSLTNSKGPRNEMKLYKRMEKSALELFIVNTSSTHHVNNT